MEKKTMPRVLALLLAVALVCTSIITVPSTQAQAATKASKITLSAKKQTLYVGKSKGSFTLKVKSVKPAKASKAVTYKSSNKSVASVNSKGKVTAKGKGTAKITVTSKSNKKAKAVCTVKVEEGVQTIKAPAELIMKKGSKAKVTLGFTPSAAKNATAKEMSFASNKKNVATAAAKGKDVQISAKKAGKATITIEPKDKSAKKVTIKVTVKNKVTAVKKITLNAKALNLNAGATETLKATLSPKKPDSKKVNWVSTDENVAKVDKKGKVTAVGNGSAKIVATAVSGGKSATCAVNVTTAATGITLDQTTLALKVGGAAATLTATVAPETVSDPTVTWSSSNPAIATVAPNGAQATVAPVAEGTAVITAATANGLTAQCTVTVSTDAPSEVEATSMDTNGNLTVTLSKTARSYRTEIPGKNVPAIDAATFASDYAKFVAELKKDIWKGNFFRDKWEKFASKLEESDLVKTMGLVSDIKAETNDNTITISGKTASGSTKTIEVVRSNDTSDSCTLAITAGARAVTLDNVTVSKAEDGTVSINADLAREGKDSMQVTMTMTEKDVKVYLNGGEYSPEKSVMTFTDNAEQNAYIITVNGTNYSHIKSNLNLSVDLKDIHVWNVQ